MKYTQKRKYWYTVTKMRKDALVSKPYNIAMTIVLDRTRTYL